MRSKRKLLWAVDARTDVPARALAAATSVLIALGERVELEPVYVRPPIGTTEAADEAAVTALVSGLDLPGLARPRLLVPDGPGRRAAARALAAYAESAEAEMIIVDKHGQWSPERRLGAGFAATLVNEAPLPLWITSPGLTTPAAMKRVLYATDLSVPSRRAFGRLLPWVASLHMPLRLFHVAAPPPPYLAMRTGGALGAPLRSEPRPRESAQLVRELLRLWVGEARAAGVLVETEVARAPSIASATLDAADRCGAGLVMLGAVRDLAAPGGAASALLADSPVPLLLAPAPPAIGRREHRVLNRFFR